jgi:hypothetical protein
MLINVSLEVLFKLIDGELFVKELGKEVVSAL